MVTHEAEKIWLSRDASVRPSVRTSAQKLHCACVSVCAACGLNAGQHACASGSTCRLNAHQYSCASLCGLTHSRSQRPRSFWSAPRIETSGRIQFSSPRFADFRSFCAVSGFLRTSQQTSLIGLFHEGHEGSNFGLEILGLGDISLKKQSTRF